MNRLIATVLLLSACTETPATDMEIHEVEACDSAWSGHHGIVSHESCEAPCVDLQDLGTRSSCTYIENGSTKQCAAGQYSDWNGRTGCCVADPNTTRVAFMECPL